MRISDWSSDGCSSDLVDQVGRIDRLRQDRPQALLVAEQGAGRGILGGGPAARGGVGDRRVVGNLDDDGQDVADVAGAMVLETGRSEERRVGKESCSRCRSRWTPKP